MLNKKNMSIQKESPSFGQKVGFIILIFMITTYNSRYVEPCWCLPITVDLDTALDQYSIYEEENKLYDGVWLEEVRLLDILQQRFGNAIPTAKYNLSVTGGELGNATYMFDASTAILDFDYLEVERRHVIRINQLELYNISKQGLKNISLTLTAR